MKEKFTCRRVSTDDFNDFLSKNFKNKTEFMKKAKLSRSHLNGLLDGRVQLGPTVASRLSKILEEYGLQLEEILEPLPMKIGADDVDEILITLNGVVIASITSRDVIAQDEYVVQFLPNNSSLS